MLYARGEGLPPEELREFEVFAQYGVMPNDGGQRDQPLGWFNRGGAMYESMQSWHVYKRGDYTAKWQRKHPGLFEWGEKMREKVEACQTNA